MPATERPDRARLLQPAVRLGDGGRALHAAVRLPDHRAPPVHHLLLHLERTGRGGVDDDLEARDVVPVLDLLGQAEEADELGRHHVGRRDPVPLDGGQGLLGVELAQDRDGLADVAARPCRSSGSHRGACRPTPGAPPSAAGTGRRGRSVLATSAATDGSIVAQPGPDDGLRLPGRARGVGDGDAQLAVRRLGRGLALDERLLGDEARRCRHRPRRGA